MFIPSTLYRCQNRRGTLPGPRGNDQPTLFSTPASQSSCLFSTRLRCTGTSALLLRAGRPVLPGTPAARTMVMQGNDHRVASGRVQWSMLVGHLDSQRPAKVIDQLVLPCRSDLRRQRLESPKVGDGEDLGPLGCVETLPAALQSRTGALNLPSACLEPDLHVRLVVAGTTSSRTLPEADHQFSAIVRQGQLTAG